MSSILRPVRGVNVPYQKSLYAGQIRGEKKMQSKRNFSAKREAIYEALSSTNIHPSAEWVYERLKPELPGLSLGTVYRNLAVFKEMGLAKSIGVINGQERFDAVMTPHPHFICRKCFRIIDVPKGYNKLERSVYGNVERECDARIEMHNITFYGLCRSCSEEKS